MLNEDFKYKLKTVLDVCKTHNQRICISSHGTL